MAIASFPFLAFALAVIVTYNSHPSVAWRKWILLVVDLIFLFTFSQCLLLFAPLAAFLAFGYLGIWTMQHSHSKAAYVSMVLGVLLSFFWLKRSEEHTS